MIELTREELTTMVVALEDEPVVILYRKLTAELAMITPPPKLDTEPEPEPT
jgi:hypothetical protein